MTTILPPPSAEDWSGPYPPNALEDGSVYFADIGGGAVTLTVSDLAPGHRVEVIMDVVLMFFGSGQTIATIGTKTVAGLVDMQRQTIRETVTVGHELECTFSGFAEITIRSITLVDQATVPDQPVPGHVLNLLAWAPIPGLSGFRIGSSRLGRDALTAGRPPQGIMVLGRDILGGARLARPADTYEWIDLLPAGNAISTVRGVDASGPILTAQAGTLTATADDAWDPRVTGIRHGTALRLIHWPTRTRIFTGSVSDVTTTPYKPGERHAYATQLTAADAVADLAAITRYGAKADTEDGTETWTARVNRLMASAATIAYQVEGTSEGTMCPTVWETSLAKHLDAACASVGGAWNVDPWGHPVLRPTLPSDAPSLTVTDAQVTDLDHDVWSYTDVDATWKASDAISSVEATTHTAGTSEDGTWEAQDETATVTDEATAYVWGGSSITVDLTVPSSTLPTAARRLLRRATDVPPPGTLTLAPAHTRGPANRAEHMARAAALDVLQPVRTTQRHETTDALTTTITHTITPRAWTTVLALTDRSTR